MQVEIWSDIMCPFCYIGKRHFEAALQQIPNRDLLEVEWKSFQLDPSIPERMDKNTSVYEYLAERKGISLADSEAMHVQVIEMARNAGLDYRFDKAIVANSLNAHRLIQMAKTKGLGDLAEEKLFHAYFTDGKDLADRNTLREIGVSIGLTEAEVTAALQDDQYAYAVHQDIQEGQQLGVRGVPFFVFDRKYGISGAQPVEAFVQTITQSLDEWTEKHKPMIRTVSEGQVCSTDGNCD